MLVRLSGHQRMRVSNNIYTLYAKIRNGKSFPKGVEVSHVLVSHVIISSSVERHVIFA